MMGLVDKTRKVKHKSKNRHHNKNLASPLFFVFRLSLTAIFNPTTNSRTTNNNMSSTKLQDLAALSSHFEDSEAIELLCTILASKADKNFTIHNDRGSMKVTFLTSNERLRIQEFMLEKLPGRSNESFGSYERRCICLKVKPIKDDKKVRGKTIRKIYEEINEADGFVKPHPLMLPENSYIDGKFCRRLYRGDELTWTVFDNSIHDNVHGAQYQLHPEISTKSANTDIYRSLKKDDMVFHLGRTSMFNDSVDDEVFEDLAKIKPFLEKCEAEPVKEYLNVSKRKRKVEIACMDDMQKAEEYYNEQVKRLKAGRDAVIYEAEKKKKAVISEWEESRKKLPNDMGFNEVTMILTPSPSRFSSHYDVPFTSI